MKKLILFALFLNATLLAGRFWQELPVHAQGPPVATKNGDIDGDGIRDMSDAVSLLNWLFQGGQEPVAFAQGSGLTDEQEEILSHFSIVEFPVNNQGSTAETIRITLSRCAARSPASPVSDSTSIS